MEDEHPDPGQKPGWLRFFRELRRRKVFRVASVYIVTGWIIIQVASATFSDFGIPIWAYRFVVLMVALGFPLAVILAWAFELTPEGIKTTQTAREEHAATAHRPEVQRKRNWLAYAMGALVPTFIFGILAGVFGIHAYYQRQQEHPSELEKSIAVLPLANMSPDPNNAFFADGVHEDILTNLAKIKSFKVISRSSVLRFRENRPSMREMAEKLNCNYIVEGSVRRAGNKVLVTVQLINATTDQHLWAENYDRDLDDIFAIQSSIAQEIAGQLKAAISPEEIERIEYRPTENQEAYDNWVKHRQLIESPNLARWDEKIAFLEKAVELDPEFAKAWAHLAIERIVQWVVEKNRNDPELLAGAHHALGQAKRLEPGIAYVQYAHAFLVDFEHQDHEAKINYLLEALAIDPSFHRAHRSLSAKYLFSGRLAEAQFHMEAALRADPLSPRTNAELLGIHQFRGMWDKARALIQLNLERTDGDELWRKRLVRMEYLQEGDQQALIAAMDAIPGFIESPEGKAWKSLLERDYRSALQRIEGLVPDDSINLSFSMWFGSNLGPLNLVSALIWFELGDEEKWLIETEKAKTNLEGIVEGDPLTDPIYWSNLTICYALEGERARMESTIEKIRELTRSPFWKYRDQAKCETHIAIAYLVLGDNDEAIDTLTQASQLEGMIFLNRELDLWFIFDRLRGDPRFDALLED